MNNLLPIIKKGVVLLLALIGFLALVLFVIQFVTPAILMKSQSYNGASPNSAGIDDYAPSVPSALYQNDAGGTYQSEKTSGSRGGGAQEGNLTERKVIKNGNLDIIVAKAEETAEKLKAIATQYNGFVNAANIYEVTDGIKSGSVTLRVPADQFDAAVREIKKLAIKVNRENINASDVTEQFVDLEARLKNLRAGEDQFLGIMKRATTVDETLRVQNQLVSIRGQIEQIQGQLTYLSRQVDMSSIVVSLTTEADVEVFGIRWRPLFVIKQAFRSMLTGLTGYVDTMVRFILYIPIILIWIATFVIVGAIGWRVFRWTRRKFFSA
jgi:hypothetical protein